VLVGAPGDVRSGRYRPISSSGIQFEVLARSEENSMKLENHFGSLLQDTVNLRRRRLEQLEERAGRIFDSIRADRDLGAMHPGMTRQGSWAQETIINPPVGREFDADFTLNLDNNPDWTPRDYLKAVRRALDNSQHHGDMTLQRKTRCVRVVYANLFHVDVVPAVTRNGVEYIANWDTDTWERTNPEAFTAWMQQKDRDARSNLRRVIRLMKYVRHLHGFDGVRSIILTTLLGGQVDSTRQFVDANYYGDLPTAFLHLVNDLDAYLWARPSKPSVLDPSGTGLTFDHRWKQNTYANFRQRLHSIAGTATTAYFSTDPDESERLWREIFGEQFIDSSGKSDAPRFGTPATTAGYISGRAG
jgi:hypothetical protein